MYSDMTFSALPLMLIIYHMTDLAALKRMKDNHHNRGWG